MERILDREGAVAGGSQRWAYPALIAIAALGLGVSAAPSPLYAVYAAQWHHRPITTTVIFAAYAVAALTAVLVTGSVSDRFGRRPLLLVATTGLLLGNLVFLVADSVAILIAARVVHGLAVGTVVVVGTAALLDLRPGDGAATGRRTGVAFNVGNAIAIIATAWNAEYGPAPLRTPYVVLAALSIVALVLVVCLRETHAEDRAVAVHVARPRVPVEIAADFRFSALSAVASWSVLGVFLSLLPTIAATAVGIDNILFGGVLVALSALTGAASMHVSAGWDARSSAIAGDLGMALSLVVCVVAVRIGDPWFVVGAGAVVGFFFGLAFGCALRHLGQVMPAAHRGEVMSAFYVLAYGALALPTVVAGLAATHWGAEAIFAPFMGCVAAACVVAGALGLRVRGVQADGR